MTRPWGSHTRSANGAKKRTDHKALGTSRVVPALWRTGAASLLSYPSKNGRLWLGIQSGYTSVSATRYRCYDPSGGGCGAPPSLTADTLNPDRIVYVEASDDGKWFTTIIDNDEQYIPSPSHEDLGLYVYEAMGATTACYARLYVQTAGDFAESVQIPHDTSDDVTLLVCTGDAALEADMQEGPSCSGTWEAGDPPATLNYRAAGTALSVQYFVYSRATAADAWTLVGGPWDRPSYTTTGRRRATSPSARERTYVRCRASGNGTTASSRG